MTDIRRKKHRFGPAHLRAAASLSAIAVVLMAASPECQAADSYTVANGASLAINEHGTCRNVVNNSGYSIMVPTKTSQEWQSFRDNAPPGVTASGACGSPPPPPGSCAAVAVIWGNTSACKHCTPAASPNGTVFVGVVSNCSSFSSYNHSGNKTTITCTSGTWITSASTCASSGGWGSGDGDGGNGEGEGEGSGGGGSGEGEGGF